MTSKQENKVSMYLAVKDFLITNAAITSPLPNYNGFFTSFQSSITQIQSYSELQMFNKSGIKTNKNQLKATLVMLSADTSRKLQAYAKFINNQLLLSETKYTESALKTVADTTLRDNAQGIYNRAQSNLTALIPYGVTAATQTSLLNAINAFLVSIPKPRIGVADTKQSTLLLGGAFKSADSALDNIDFIIDIVKLSQPNFYNNYKSVRRIIDNGTGTLAVKGVIKDATNGDSIKGAIISFMIDGNVSKSTSDKSQNVVVKKSATKGGFYIKSLASGIYKVTISKNGYVSKEETIAVSDNELTILNVNMSKN